MKNGFTLFEVIIVVIILVILAAVTIPNFLLFLKGSELSNGFQELVSIIRLAQSRTLTGEQAGQYGVYLDTSVSPHKYVLYKGANYAARDTSYDQSYFLPNSLEFYGISLGGPSEVVFDRLTGTTVQSGSVSVRIKTDISRQKTLYIANSGTISFTAPTIIADTRVKDSRHLHFNYSRIIITATESITLTLDGTVNQVIPMATFTSGGKFGWSGKVNVGGVDQVLKIHTHRLNNPDTQFSIHRDRRFNNKSLVVTISGDASGNLASYSADGLTTNFTSLFVSNFLWQ